MTAFEKARTWLASTPAWRRIVTLTNRTTTWAKVLPWRHIAVVAWPVSAALSLAYGARLIFPPAGWITLGALILADVWDSQRRQQPATPRPRPNSLSN